MTESGRQYSHFTVMKNYDGTTERDIGITFVRHACNKKNTLSCILYQLYIQCLRVDHSDCAVRFKLAISLQRLNRRNTVIDSYFKAGLLLKGRLTVSTVV